MRMMERMEVFFGRRFVNDQTEPKAELKDLVKRKHAVKDVDGEISCTVAVFGDPLFTVPKHCICQPGAGSSKEKSAYASRQFMLGGREAGPAAPFLAARLRLPLRAEVGTCMAVVFPCLSLTYMLRSWDLGLRNRGGPSTLYSTWNKRMPTPKFEPSPVPPRCFKVTPWHVLKPRIPEPLPLPSPSCVGASP